MLAALKAFYERNKIYLVYGQLGIIFALVYLGHIFGPLLKYVLPAFVISVVTILFETLHSLQTRLHSTFIPEYYPAIADAAQRLKSIVQHDRMTTVEVLGASGGATVQTILPIIVNASKAEKIRIIVHLIDDASPVAQWFPRHWRSEVQQSIEILKARYHGPRFELTIYTYCYLPVISGVLVNNMHLFIGAFRWKKIGEAYDLTSADRAHRYLRGRVGTDLHFFELFENWTHESPCHKLLYSSTVPETAAGQPAIPVQNA